MNHKKEHAATTSEQVKRQIRAGYPDHDGQPDDMPSTSTGAVVPEPTPSAEEIDQSETRTTEEQTSEISGSHDDSPQECPEPSDHAVPPIVVRMQPIPPRPLAERFTPHFFLLSFAMLLWGLYLIRTHVGFDPQQISTMMLTFTAQQGYEFLLLGFGLVLIRARRNRDHGLTLLFLLPLLMFDLSAMHRSTAGLSTFAGKLTGSLSLLLAGLKIGLVVNILSLRIHWDRLVWLLTGLSIVSISPLMVDQVLHETGMTSLAIDPMRLYSLWFLAGAAAFPFIIKNETVNTLVPTPNRLVKDENILQSWWIAVAAVMVPGQLVSHHGLQGSSAMVVPYFLAGVFMLSVFFQRSIRELVGRNEFHFLGLFGMFWLASYADYSIIGDTVASLNKGLVYGALIATAILLKNIYSGGFLGAVALYHGGNAVGRAAQQTYTAARGLSRLAWGILMLSGSFILLIVGFLVSLKGKDPNRSETAQIS